MQTNQLDGPTLVDLVDVFADLYNNAKSARKIASAAGLDVGSIDFEGSASDIWYEILSHANPRGQVLDLLYEALKKNRHNAKLLGAMEQLTRPAMQPPELDPKGPSGDELGGVLERMVSGEDALVDVCYLEAGLERAQAVARIVFTFGGRERAATGFLVADPKLRRCFLMTNHHVLPNKAVAASAEAQFNFQRLCDGSSAAPRHFPLDPEAFFMTSAPDDWTAVAVKGHPESKFKPLRLAKVELKVGARVNIIQHPHGLPKQMSFFHNSVVFADAKTGRAQYLTDTDPGSSGSPVFDRHWQLVALHHSGGMLRKPGVKSQRVYYRNEGILINAVLDGMEDIMKTRPDAHLPAMKIYPAPNEQIDIGEYIAYHVSEAAVVARIYVDAERTDAGDRTVEHWVFLASTPYDGSQPLHVVGVPSRATSLSEFLSDVARQPITKYTITRAETYPSPSPASPPRLNPLPTGVLADGGYRIFQKDIQVGAIQVENQVESWGVARSYDENIGFDLKPDASLADYARWANYVNDAFAGGVHWVVTSQAGSLPLR